MLVLGKLCRIFLIFVLFSSIVGQHSGALAKESEQYYTIIVEKRTDFSKFLQEVTHLGIEVVYQVEEIGLFQVKGSPEKIALLRKENYIDNANPSIRAVSQEIASDSVNLSLPSLWDSQWDMKEVTQNGESYNIYNGSKNVTVGIIDSGITPSHHDLKNNIIPGSKNLVPKGGFRGEEPNETGNPTQIQDLTGHGTHVAGQIAANGYIKGVAPNIGIKSYRVFGSSSSDSIWVVKAIIEAANDDVDVINLSLGSYLIKGKTFSNDGTSTEELAEIKAYKKAVKYAQNKGTVVVAAVGNDSLNISDKKAMNTFIEEKLKKDGITFKGKVLDIPATLPGVVTVASTGPSNQLSTFSNYGKNFVDISAPGGDYRYLQKFGVEKWVQDGWLQKEQILSTAPNGAYFYSSGTSIATPKVSGTLALIIDKYNYKDEPQKAIHHLYNYGTQTENEIKIDELGRGRIDVARAISQ